MDRLVKKKQVHFGDCHVIGVADQYERGACMAGSFKDPVDYVACDDYEDDETRMNTIRNSSWITDVETANRINNRNNYALVMARFVNHTNGQHHQTISCMWHETRQRYQSYFAYLAKPVSN